MWPRLQLAIVISSAAILFAALYVTYRWVDPLPRSLMPSNCSRKTAPGKRKLLPRGRVFYATCTKST